VSGHDEIAARNERHWERMVKAGCGFTVPWLDLDRPLLRRHARGQLDPVPEPLIGIYPASVLADLDGKDVLCLACGGGQQSAVFGLLGARVTVVDLAEGQLDGDRTAAAHYGYEVTTVRADMRDLSCFRDESFDLVYGEGMCYVPDVGQVYSEVARVLRPGGLYRVGVTNPGTEFVDTDSWDGQGYRITVPYAVQRVEHDMDGPVEFRHYWADIFNGLLAVGLFVQAVHDDPCHLRHNPRARPGSWQHMLAYVQWGLAIVVRKKSKAS